jgi:L-ribulokinase
MKYTIGLDYGTNSVRALLVNTKDGTEVASNVWQYESGDKGVILDSNNHLLARQNAMDYIKGFTITVKNVLGIAEQVISDFDSKDVVGIGIDTTGSSPMSIGKDGLPLSENEKYKNNPNAYVWLWKDHTSYKEAAEITELAKQIKPEYLSKCGGRYSSEWFFSKILHCLKIDSEVFEDAYTWVEICDYIPAFLTGNNSPPENIIRSQCAAGHKAMYNREWGGLPDKEFLSKLNPKLAELRDRLYSKTYTIDYPAGFLKEDIAKDAGLREGIPVAVGAFDSHLGAIGAGIKENTIVKIIGTSTCDIMMAKKLDKDIPGICGIVKGSVLPDYYGLEAGQSAVGDIFNWFVKYIQPYGDKGTHDYLTTLANSLKPGESGLLCLDWHNGNRTILVDQELSGLILGLQIQTKPEEIYRALIEATGFGALTIINRFEEFGVNIHDVIVCGGIPKSNKLLPQIYADIMNREIKCSKSNQTCALGAAIAAAVVAGKKNGGYDSFNEAQMNMSSSIEHIYKPNLDNYAIYKEIFQLYIKLHNAFGIKGLLELYDVMKKLLAIKERIKRC